MKKKSFTLIEALVVIIIIGIFAGISAAFFKGDYSAQRKCSANLKIISNAIEAYRDAVVNNGQYPPDGTVDPAQNLKWALYPAYISNGSVFKCPSDTTAGSTDSYSAFYVKRNKYSKMTSFSAGCPRHDGGKYAINAFFQGQIMRRKIADTKTGVKPGETISSVTLADNSTVSVSGGFVTFIQSFDIGGGKCYSLFKTGAAAKDIVLSVTSGSKLEVITPSMIAGVEGTAFTVKVISAISSKATVTSGRVFVEEKTGKGVISVLPGRESTVNSGSRPTII